MQSAVNVKLGKREDRALMLAPIYLCCINHLRAHRTGIHTVADAFCVGCDERLGWYYHKAADHSQKYKECA